jgi:alkanesulfonate monooxygenase SsuD/methylene tetrahydromethanopterin reductase-like flavin-dependent oxidoreductase (luciferase family)
MKLSITVTDHAWSDGVDGLRRVVELADQGGIDTIWVPDHLFQADPTSHPQAELFEGFSLLGYLAAITSRVRLGMLVSPVPFRPPAVQVKAIATLDAFTRGRAWFGVGIGWEGDEARAMGIPLGPAKERFEQLEELLDIADRMFAGDSSPYAGKHFQLDGPICSPRPAGHVPVLIGGTGSRRHCGWSRGGRTRAICSTCRTAVRRSATSSTYCASTVTTQAARTTTSRRRCRPG